MATVHLGRLVGPAGFHRLVAVKRLHPRFARDPEVVRSFIEEARIAARLRHPNVVPTLDVVVRGEELLLIMEYVHGEALHRLLRSRGDRPRRLPPRIIGAILRDVLEGLHSAHRATDGSGRPLGLVHRDVSPHNVIVGADGLARVLDFGIAVATERARGLPGHGLAGKLPYMAPEQLLSGEVTPRTDVFGAAVILWEGLAGARLFPKDATITELLEAEIREPPGAPALLTPIVMRGLSRSPALRFASAGEMAEALERVVALATRRELGAWVQAEANKTLLERAELIARWEHEPAPEPVPAGVGGAAPVFDGGDTLSTHTDPDVLREVLDLVFSRGGRAPEVRSSRVPPHPWSTPHVLILGIVLGALLLLAAWVLGALAFPAAIG